MWWRRTWALNTERSPRGSDWPTSHGCSQCSRVRVPLCGTRSWPGGEEALSTTRPLWDGGPCSLCPHVVLERMQSQQLLPPATAHPRPRARSVHTTVAVCLLCASGLGSSCTSSGEIHRSSTHVSLPRQPGPSLRCRASPAGPGHWCGQHRVRSRVLAGGRLLPWHCCGMVGNMIKCNKDSKHICGLASKAIVLAQLLPNASTTWALLAPAQYNGHMDPLSPCPAPATCALLAPAQLLPNASPTWVLTPAQLLPSELATWVLPVPVQCFSRLGPPSPCPVCQPPGPLPQPSSCPVCWPHGSPQPLSCPSVPGCSWPLFCSPHHPCSLHPRSSVPHLPFSPRRGNYGEAGQASGTSSAYTA